MFRPMTSVVSALSGIVANGHQTVYFVSSAPSKIPYGGFSPVRLQAGSQQRPSPPCGGFAAAIVEVSSVRVLFRSRACARRHSRPLTPHTCPVALGSASGYAVRRPHRLLWPHPSFWSAPPVLSIIASGLCATQKVPTFIWQSLMTCCRPYSDGFSHPVRLQIADLAFTHLPGVRQPYFPTHQSTCGTFNEAATFALCCGPSSCWPRSGRDVYSRACATQVTSGYVGYDYTGVRHTRDRTYTGCSVSLVGCTVDKGEKIESE